MPSADLSVVICFQFSIFEPLDTTRSGDSGTIGRVVICFQFSIFEPLDTNNSMAENVTLVL